MRSEERGDGRRKARALTTTRALTTGAKRKLGDMISQLGSKLKDDL